MKNNLLKTITTTLEITVSSFANAQKVAFPNSLEIVSYSKETNLPNFIKLKEGKQITANNFTAWASVTLNLPKNSSFKPYETFNDLLGYSHTRYKQYVNNLPIEGTMLISHSNNDKITAINGDYVQQLQSTYTTNITEAKALQYALKKVNATRYMWQGNSNDNVFNKQRSTYYPKGELVVVHKRGADYTAKNMRLAYKFNIYAQQPLYKANVCIDATTGEFLSEEQLIHTGDVVGTSITKYSGTVTMTSDNVGAGQYELHETGRGNGITTRNQQNTTSGADIAFTSASSTWTTTGTDQAATDAHWGAEMAYDYYKNKHNRNSIDNAGFALTSYVHYDVNLVNAFWDGVEMVYGDGNPSQGFDIMTALDVCGHEITHGLVTYSAALSGGGMGEPDALNEGFADIFGTSIEAFARPSQNDWLMGADIMASGSGLRNLKNPKLRNDPDTYLGTNWDPAGEPHKNATPVGHWYYLLCQGGSGTNDINNTYTVTGITIAKAEKIAFRGLTVYGTPSTSYADARTYTIQAATDLYGVCSAELQATTNAWYAIGVGAAFVGAAPAPAFTANTTICALPANIQFMNTSVGATTYTWNFGDGSATSTATSPSHSYTTAGTYTVTLTASGGTCGGGSTNTITQVINLTTATAASIPLVEGFETNSSLPTAWSLANSDADAAWQISTLAAKTGVNSIGLNNCNGNGNADMTGKKDRFYTNPYNFSTATNPVLTFDVGYTTISSGGITYTDTLVVYASNDCGATWNSVYYKGGTDLATAPNVVAGSGSSACWAPATSEWRNESISLTAYAGNANVMFAVENRSGWGQWLFLDNININSTATVAISEKLLNHGIIMYPNPVHDNVTITTTQNSTSLTLTNLLGQTVAETAGLTTLSTISTSHLSNGMYVLKITLVDGTTQELKIVKE